jgi:hypothetical protein
MPRPSKARHAPAVFAQVRKLAAAAP